MVGLPSVEGDHADALLWLSSQQLSDLRDDGVESDWSSRGFRSADYLAGEKAPRDQHR